MVYILLEVNTLIFIKKNFKTCVQFTFYLNSIPSKKQKREHRKESIALLQSSRDYYEAEPAHLSQDTCDHSPYGPLTNRQAKIGPFFTFTILMELGDWSR